MEGGGERKRKGVPIALDWDWLMPPGAKDDEVPPELVIENAAEKSKPREELMMEYEEEEPHRDHYLEKMSDKELIEKFHRVKSSLGTMSSRLPDGGEKLRANLKSTEAEMERRKLLKVGDKYKKAIPLDDESTLTGVSPDLSPRGAPPPVPRPQSTFGLHFCSNLDKRATEPFGEELSTLDCSNHKNMREKNRPYLTQRTHRTGLSSRQAPFKCPRHLSVNIDDLPQSNGELSVSYSSATSPQQFDKDLPGYFRKKETAPHSQPILTSRRNKRKTVVLVDEEELEVYEIDHADVGRSSKEARIYYPSRDDPEAIEICYSDLECLAPESYLSSNIMNFYIRYLQKPTSPSARKRYDCHFFNTYFYKKLKEDVLTKIDKETSFVKFRRWWKGVDIFEKTYIFLPIHENLHWSLVIICIPSKEENSGPVILHLDSLGLHTSKSIFNDVKSFIIQEWKFLKQEKVLPELSIADNIWDKLSRRIEEKVVKVPQQRNEYDCGLFVLCFIERFIEEAPNRLKEGDLTMFGKEWFRPEEASSLRRKISSLLREEFKNANEGTCKSDP